MGYPGKPRKRQRSKNLPFTKRIIQQGVALISVSSGLIIQNNTACVDGKYKTAWSCLLSSLPQWDYEEKNAFPSEWRCDQSILLTSVLQGATTNCQLLVVEMQPSGSCWSREQLWSRSHRLWLKNLTAGSQTQFHHKRYQRPGRTKTVLPIGCSRSGIQDIIFRAFSPKPAL